MTMIGEIGDNYIGLSDSLEINTASPPKHNYDPITPITANTADNSNGIIPSEHATSEVSPAAEKKEADDVAPLFNNEDFLKSLFQNFKSPDDNRASSVATFTAADSSSYATANDDVQISPITSFEKSTSASPKMQQTQPELLSIPPPPMMMVEGSDDEKVTLFDRSNKTNELAAALRTLMGNTSPEDSAKLLQMVAQMAASSSSSLLQQPPKSEPVVDYASLLREVEKEEAELSELETGYSRIKKEISGCESTLKAHDSELDKLELEIETKQEVLRKIRKDRDFLRVLQEKAIRKQEESRLLIRTKADRLLQLKKKLPPNSASRSSSLSRDKQPTSSNHGSSSSAHHASSSRHRDGRSRERSRDERDCRSSRDRERDVKDHSRNDYNIDRMSPRDSRASTLHAVSKDVERILSSRDRREREEGGSLKRGREPALDNNRRSIKLVSSSSPSQKNDTLCYLYNKKGCDRPDCQNLHCCIICGLGHPMANCPKDRNICVKYNMGDCKILDCHREHRCLRCASNDHRLDDCIHQPPNTTNNEFCFAWNSSSSGICLVQGGGTCHRSHKCIRCGSGSHHVLTCPMNIDVYWQECRGQRSYVMAYSSSSSNSYVPSSSPVTQIRNASNTRNLPVRLSSEARSGICHDWNAGRCDFSRDRCKFKHCCSACGDRDHRDRKCPLFVLNERGRH